MPQHEKPFRTASRHLTWGNFLWLVIAVFTIITIVVMVWASKQPPLYTEPAPSLSTGGD